MDSMPGRSTRHQSSSLLGLPQDLRIEIAARVGATLERPFHGDVGRHLSIEGIRDEISWVWNPTVYKAFLAMLSGHGNPKACFLFGIKAFFIEHWGYDDLWRATEGGHDAAAYLCAILLYRDNGGAAPLTTPRRGTRGWRQYDVEMVEQRGVSAFAWEGRTCAPLLDLAHLGEPLPPPAQVRGDQPCAGTGGGCGVEEGWLRISLFCSEDCRLRCEMVKFALSIGVGNQ
jgi:hypothetical protein